MNISRITIVTLKIPLKEPSREFTIILRFLLCEIKRSGLRILSILRIFSTSRELEPPPISKLRIISYIDAITMTKSSLFQDTVR